MDPQQNNPVSNSNDNSINEYQQILDKYAQELSTAPDDNQSTPEPSLPVMPSQSSEAVSPITSQPSPVSEAAAPIDLTTAPLIDNDTHSISFEPNNPSLDPVAPPVSTPVNLDLPHELPSDLPDMAAVPFTPPSPPAAQSELPAVSVTDPEPITPAPVETLASIPITPTPESVKPIVASSELPPKLPDTTVYSFEVPIAPPVAPLTPPVAPAVPVPSAPRTPQIAIGLNEPIVTKPVEPKKTSSSFAKYFFIVTLIIFLAIAGIIGYNIYKTGQNTKPIIIPSNQAPTATPGAAGAACTVNDVSYQSGQTFPAADGVNTCTCLENGTISCTDKEGGDTKGGLPVNGTPESYQGGKLGIAFDYPAGWIVDDSSTKNQISITSTSLGASLYGMTITKLTKAEFDSSISKLSNTTTQKVTLGGLPATQVTTAGDKPVTFTYLQYKGSYYSFSGAMGLVNDDNFKTILDSIKIK